MKKNTIGLLPLYIKLYDDINFNREKLDSFYTSIVDRFEKEDFNVLKTPFCCIKNEFEAAVNYFEINNADVIVTVHMAYSPSLESIDVLSLTKLPLVILDTTPDFDFSPLQNPEALMFNHGIHGVMDLCNMLKRRNKDFAIAAGHIENSDVFNKTCNYIRAAVAANSLKEMKIGSFGKSFEGMGDFLVSPYELKDRFGCEVKYIDLNTVQSYSNKINENEIEEEKQKYKKEFIWQGEIEEKALNASVKASLIVRKIILDYDLKAFTLNFNNISNSYLGSMPFIECCKQMQNGLGYAGEGDVLTAAFTGAVLSAFKEASFIEIFCPDWKNNQLFISHMGEMNYGVADGKPFLKQCDFIFNETKACIKAYARFKGGNAVFCNIYQNEDNIWSLLLSDIEMQSIKKDNFSDCIRGWFKPPTTVGNFLEKLSINGATHHSFIIYGIDKSAMEYFGKLLKLKVMVI